MSSINTPEAALRLARTIASDILLYNKDKIAEGLKTDRLFDVLAEDIAEGRKLYDGRVSTELREQYDFLDRALVDVLIKSSARVPTNIW
jgi:hypothetical protein